ncbi:MAG: site-specific DNA-methyltransferase [Candidatus Kapabacteria bacterium]|nr:site-specific DNA-methyltransferase [Candidatus Kapabacteria bacterium]
MDNLKMHSPNLTQTNIDRIRELFPGCVTEAKGADGNMKLAVDFDQLRQELSESIVEGPQERYHLNWPGKREALLTANAPIAKTLRPCREESVDFDTTKNLFIEGDNLDALKLLQETYLGKVKMIYIDPPYNTGNDFIYEDDFAEGTEEFLLRSNQKDEEGNRLVANTNANGRFHSDWLSMLYPRVKLARTLLREDGVLFISIDDREAENVKQLVSEIFGRDNFLAQICWEKVHTRKNSARTFSVSHEYVIAIARNREKWDRILLPRDNTDAYKNPDNHPKGPWKLDPITAHNPYEADYKITKPNGVTLNRPEGSYWRFSEATIKEKIKNKEIVWGDGDSYPMIKRFLAEVQAGLVPTTLFDRRFAGDTATSKKEVDSLFGVQGIFDYAKPTLLVKRLLQISCRPGEIFLDFFAGTSTSAHALMSLNAEDAGNRRFVMVQAAESVDDGSVAAKAGYTTIAELSKERIRRAGKKVKKDNDGKPRIDQLDIGFRVLKVDTSNMADVFYAPDTLDQSGLGLFVDNIKADRTAEDLLFQVMLDWGIDLALPIARENIQGKDVFFVDGNELAACFDASGGIDEEFVNELAKRKPLRVVFRDAGFKDSAVKINVEQIFKVLSPATDVKCI